MIFVFVAHDLFFSRLLMTFEFLMCLFPAHFFGGFSKDTHDCCISHVVICCSWVFSVCFFNRPLMTFELLMVFFGYSWVLFCTWVAAHAWVPLYGQLLMRFFLHMRSCLCMSTPLYEQPLMSVFAHEQLLMHEYPSEQLLMSAFFSHE